MPRNRAASSSQDETNYSDETQRRTQTQQRNRAKKQKNVKGKQKRKSNAPDGSSGDEDEDDEDDDDDAPGTGTAGRRAGRRALPEEQRQELVAAMTRHILFTEHTRKAHTRQHMIAAVLSKPEHKGLFNTLIPLVQTQLRDVFGMELVPLRAKENQSQSAPKSYALRSTLPAELVRMATTQTFAELSLTRDDNAVANQRKLKIFGPELAEWHEDGDLLPTDRPRTAPVRDVKREEGAAYGILGVILALCLVNGKAITDDQLVMYLRRLSLTPSTVIPMSINSAHGDQTTLAKYIDQLVQQGYLEKAASTTGGAAAATQIGKSSGRVPSTQRTQRASGVEAGDPGIEYRWGARSEVELGEVGIAKFIQYVYEVGQNGQVVPEEDEADEGGDGDAVQQQQQQQQTVNRERLMKEIARAAGTKKLQSAYPTAGGGGGGSEDEDEDAMAQA
ncbi:hypothetical protein ACM66B_000412 [Microbotryomycetes sp. NB124-2]